MQKELRYIDLFSGIGGFRIAAEKASKILNITPKCVFSSEIDPSAIKTYQENFGDIPHGDISKIDPTTIPNHDILFAGFPCQPFSIIGQMKGFFDTRGTLFFDISRILEEKSPKAFVLENVKQLVGHHKGTTFKRIVSILNELGYFVDYKVLNARNFGLPQKRERVVIIGLKESFIFSWPEKHYSDKKLSDILEKNVDKKYYASENIKNKRKKSHKSNYYPSIWHENKAGNISSYPFSCALRANASYNYLLVNGERRFTPRELLRLQGFPDNFKIVVSDMQIRKQTGNAVPVNVIESVLLSFLPIVLNSIYNDTNKNNKYIEDEINVREPIPAFAQC